MRKTILLSLFIAAPLWANGFLNNADSPIMYGASQFYQYRTSRIDTTLRNSLGTSTATSTHDLTGQRIQNQESEKSLSILALQRMPRSSGAIGLRIRGTQSNNLTTIEQGRYQGQFFEALSQEEELSAITSSATISPLMSYDLGKHLTFGIEYEIDYRRSSSQDMRSQETSQTALPSLTIHGTGFEVGAVFRPTSRANYLDLNDTQKVIEKSRTHRSYTFFARQIFFNNFALGGFHHIDDFSDYKDLAQSDHFPTTPRRQIGGHIEYFASEGLKFEFTLSHANAASVPEGTLSRDSAARTNMTAGLLYRSEGESTFVVNFEMENSKQKLELTTSQQIVGHRHGIRIGGHWKM